jgi:hypothetical protein
MFDQVADGLLVLRDVTSRTLVVLSCLPNTWILLKEKAVATVTDRFREPYTLRRIDSPRPASRSSPATSATACGTRALPRPIPPGRCAPKPS